MAGHPAVHYPCYVDFAYTYVLLCADGGWYIGSTDNLRRRVDEHNQGMCDNTRKRLPVELVYYEACRSLEAARAREHQLKTGYGRGYLNKRLHFEDKSCRPS